MASAGSRSFSFDFRRRRWCDDMRRRSRSQRKRSNGGWRRWGGRNEWTAELLCGGKCDGEKREFFADIGILFIGDVNRSKAKFHRRTQFISFVSVSEQKNDQLDGRRIIFGRNWKNDQVVLNQNTPPAVQRNPPYLIETIWSPSYST